MSFVRTSSLRPVKVRQDVREFSTIQKLKRVLCTTPSPRTQAPSIEGACLCFSFLGNISLSDNFLWIKFKSRSRNIRGCLRHSSDLYGRQQNKNRPDKEKVARSKNVHFYLFIYFLSKCNISLSIICIQHREPQIFLRNWANTTTSMGYTQCDSFI